jgi:hypothetical protein
MRDIGGQQLHALTGYGTARQFGGGSALTGAALEAAEARGKQLAAKGAAGQLGWWGRRKLRKAPAAEEAARKAHGYMLKAEEGGREAVTSLPGFARAMAKDPRKAMRTAYEAQIKGMTPVQKAMMFGLPVGIAGVGAATAKPGERGEAAGESLGYAASNILPFTAMPSMTAAMLPTATMMPTMLMSQPFMHAGRAIGRGVDWAAGKLTGQPAQQVKTAGRVLPPEGE